MNSAIAALIQRPLFESSPLSRPFASAFPKFSRIPQQGFRMPAAPVKFTHRVPNVSGGLVTGTARIEQRTDHVRTHTLHDPVAYQRREVGRWIVEGELPEPTWYS